MEKNGRLIDAAPLGSPSGAILGADLGQTRQCTLGFLSWKEWWSLGALRGCAGG